MIAEVWEGSRAEAYTRDPLYGSLAIGVSYDVAQLREQGSRYCPYSCCRAPCPLLADTWGSPSPEPSLHPHHSAAARAPEKEEDRHVFSQRP